MRYEISVSQTLKGRHFLEWADGSREKSHGHNWKIEVVVGADSLDQQGLVMDFRKLKKSLRSVTRSLTVSSINRHPFFKKRKINPSAEHVAHFVYDHMQKDLSGSGVGLSKVTVWETPWASASILGIPGSARRSFR